MGTRTWSRKGVLTAAGRRRQALGIGGVRQSPIAVSFDTSTTLAPNPLSSDTFAAGGAFQKALLQRFIDSPFTDNADIKQLVTLPLSDLIMRDGGVIAQSLLYDMLGFNAPPTVESWEDVESGVGIEKAPNGIPLTGYRGIGGQSAARYAEDLREGSAHWVGTGMRGNGTFIALIPYADTVFETQLTGKVTGNQLNKPFAPTMQERVDLAYAHSKMYGPLTTAIGIKKGARTNVAQIESNPPTGKGEDKTSAEPWIKNIQAEFNARYGLNLPPFRTLGFMAAALGYDALVMEGSGTQYATRGDNHTIILNRGIMVISSTDRQLK
jgi:hypothetical protein